MQLKAGKVYAEAAAACCPWLCFSWACTPLCRREEAYEEAVAQLGGIHSAQPKMVLERLQPEFPDLTLEVGWAITPRVLSAGGIGIMCTAGVVSPRLADPHPGGGHTSCCMQAAGSEPRLMC